MLKKLTAIVLATVLVFALAGCRGERTGQEEGGDYKIGIITGTVSQGEEEFQAAQNMAAKYGDKIVTATYPDNFASETETVIAQVEALAANPDVKAIVFVQAVPGAAAAIDKVRETRPDMLFIAGVAAEDGYHVWQLIVNKLARRRADYDLAKPLVCIGLAGLAFAATFIPAVEDILLFVRIPVTTYLAIAGLCLFNTWLLRTRLGQNMRTVGQSRTVANAAGLNVDRIRIIAMILSTVLACWGQLIYLQNIGTFSTYGAHTQVGQFAIAALLVGGASVQRANNKQAVLGVILFHTLFIVAPQAGKELFNNAQLGEYFRVFVAYGVIAVSLAMHAWKTAIRPKLGAAAPISQGGGGSCCS